MCSTGNNFTYYSRGGGEESNRRAGGGAGTQRGIAPEDSGWSRNSSDHCPKRKSSCTITRNGNSVTP